MKTYSSTPLNLYARNCPHALTLDEAGTTYCREIFQTGISAHAILQVAAEKNPDTHSQFLLIADAVVEELLTDGRSYNGVHEPPMAPEAALEGRELASEWMAMNGMPEGLMSPEIGLGIDCDGNPVAYGDKSSRYRGILDLVYQDIDGDEECQYDVLVVRDYKSAWPAGENELNTVQRKGQALLALKHMGANVQAIRMEICNLRTGMTHDRTIMLDEQGLEIMAQWEREILMLCRVADNNREARPGSNCLGCRFVLDCEHTNPHNDAYSIAESFAVAQAVRDEFVRKAKLAITEGTIPAGDGLVGYQAQTRRRMQEDGHIELLRAWNTAQGKALEDLDPGTLSLIKALRLGATQIDAMAKTLYPDRGTGQDRDAFSAECMEEFKVSQFGVWR